LVKMRDSPHTRQPKVLKRTIYRPKSSNVN
jgi:hypothetical protein